MVRLTCLGTSDAFNSAGRGHSCYWVDDGAGAFVVDFGPTGLLQVERLGLDLDRLDAVYLTHLHGDHIGGLGVLICGLQYRFGRTRPLVIGGPPGHAARVAAVLDASYPTLSRNGLRFPLIFRTWKVPGTIECGARSITAIRARHDRLAMACSLRISTADRTLAFSGDTGWQPQLAELAAETDVFVCECSNVERGYWAHLSLAEIEARRSTLTAKHLWLTHFSAASRRAASARADELRFTVADDGMVLDL